MCIIMASLSTNNGVEMNTFSKTEKARSSFEAKFVVLHLMKHEKVILAVFEGVCKVFQAVGQEVANRQADQWS